MGTVRSCTPLPGVSLSSGLVACAEASIIQRPHLPGGAERLQAGRQGTAQPLRRTCLRADHCVLPAELPGGMEPVSVTAAGPRCSAACLGLAAGTPQQQAGDGCGVRASRSCAGLLPGCSCRTCGQGDRTCGLHPTLPGLCEGLPAGARHGRKAHGLHLLRQVLLVRDDADHQLHATTASAAQGLSLPVRRAARRRTGSRTGMQHTLRVRPTYCSASWPSYTAYTPASEGMGPEACMSPCRVTRCTSASTGAGASAAGAGAAASLQPAGAEGGCECLCGCPHLHHHHQLPLRARTGRPAGRGRLERPGTLQGRWACCWGPLAGPSSCTAGCTAPARG